MMIFSILAIAALGVMLQNFTIYQQLLEKLSIDNKPWNCTVCATFWYSVGPLWYHWGPLTGIGMAAIAAIVAEWIDQQINFMKS